MESVQIERSPAISRTSSQFIDFYFILFCLRLNSTFWPTNLEGESGGRYVLLLEK